MYQNLISAMSEDILLNIFSYLSMHELLAIRQVNKSWYALADQLLFEEDTCLQDSKVSAVRPGIELEYSQEAPVNARLAYQQQCIALIKKYSELVIDLIMQENLVIEYDSEEDTDAFTDNVYPDIRIIHIEYVSWERLIEDFFAYLAKIFATTIEFKLLLIKHLLRNCKVLEPGFFSQVQPWHQIHSFLHLLVGTGDHEAVAIFLNMIDQDTKLRLINQESKPLGSPLFVALNGNNVKMVEVLKNHGADIRMMFESSSFPCFKLTPFELAVLLEKVEFLEALYLDVSELSLLHAVRANQDNIITKNLFKLYIKKINNVRHSRRDYFSSISAAYPFGIPESLLDAYELTAKKIIKFFVDKAWPGSEAYHAYVYPANSQALCVPKETEVEGEAEVQRDQAESISPNPDSEAVAFFAATEAGYERCCEAPDENELEHQS